jgi:hypothetical protein
MAEPLPRFAPDELSRFLEAVDAHLDAPVRMYIIGGSAAALGYGVDTLTRDLDIFESGRRDRERITSAAELARADTGLALPVEFPAVADVPWNFEDRVQRILPHLLRLEPLVLERHDLVLSKLVRGHENDMLHIQAIHELVPLDLDVLVSRYLAEMGHAATNLRSMDLNLLSCVDRLFGELKRERVRARLPNR